MKNQPQQSDGRRKKVFFVRMSDFPIANAVVGDMLPNIFAEYDVEVFDLLTIAKQKPSFLIFNSIATIWQYGFKIVRRQRRPWNCFFATTYFFRWVKGYMSKQHAGNDVVFSFQMQSMFDASKEGVPHFVYTDNTTRCNLGARDFDPRGLPHPAWLALEYEIYDNAAKVFTRSTNVRMSVIQDYGSPEEKVVRVYAGSNVAVPSSLRLDIERYAAKRILFVGIDWQRKGGPDLIAAFKRIQSRHPDATLTVVGCHVADLPENCRSVGRVPLEELPGYFTEASIFCMPTKLEPFGIVYVEAMNYALPVVGTNVGGVSDMIEPGVNGMLVEPGDVDALARALDDLLQDSEMSQRFGQASKRLAEERYTWDRVAARFRKEIDLTLQKTNTTCRPSAT